MATEDHITFKAKIKNIASLPSRVFYGWWVVTVAFFLSLLMGGVVVLGFTAFFEPIAREFGWSYAQISLAASLQGAESGFMSPLVGYVVDRWGPRRIVVISAIVTGIGLLLVSQTSSLGMFYGAFAITSLGYSGFSPTVMMTAVSNWFRRKIGSAIGIMASGFACGGLMIPVIVRLIDLYSWRTAILILTLIMWSIGIPLAFLLRPKPEKYGCLPDGDKVICPDKTTEHNVPRTVEKSIGVKDALTSRTFWHIGIGVACQYLAINGVAVHVMPYLSSVGIARSTSSLIATAVPLVSVAGRIGSGWFGDRFEKKWVAAGSFAIICAGLVFFSFTTVTSMVLLVPFVILFGIGWGSNVTMRAALLRDYFGRDRFGSILGFVMGLVYVGSVLGPFVAGWTYDNFGSYHYAWMAFAALNIVGLMVIATTPKKSA